MGFRLRRCWLLNIFPIGFGCNPFPYTIQDVLDGWVHSSIKSCLYSWIWDPTSALDCWIDIWALLKAMNLAAEAIVAFILAVMRLAIIHVFNVAIGRSIALRSSLESTKCIIVRKRSFRQSILALKAKDLTTNVYVFPPSFFTIVTNRWASVNVGTSDSVAS